jgi:hypothetical protein
MGREISSSKGPLYDEMSTEQRRELLHSLLIDLGKNIQQLAYVVRAMVTAGDEITEIAPKTVRLLLAVADKRLPTRFFTHPEANRIMGFTPEEQEIVFEDRPIDVLSSDGTVLKTKTSSMQKEQRAQVFARDHIRNDAEQRAWIEAQRMRPIATSSDESGVRETSKGIEVRIGGGVMVLPWDDLCIRVARRMSKG